MRRLEDRPANNFCAEIRRTMIEYLKAVPVGDRKGAGRRAGAAGRRES